MSRRSGLRIPKNLCRGDGWWWWAVDPEVPLGFIRGYVEGSDYVVPVVWQRTDGPFQQTIAGPRVLRPWVVCGGCCPMRMRSTTHAFRLTEYPILRSTPPPGPSIPVLFTLLVGRMVWRSSDRSRLRARRLRPLQPEGKNDQRPEGAGMVGAPLKMVLEHRLCGLPGDAHRFQGAVVEPFRCPGPEGAPQPGRERHRQPPLPAVHYGMGQVPERILLEEPLGRQPRTRSEGWSVAA